MAAVRVPTSLRERHEAILHALEVIRSDVTSGAESSFSAAPATDRFTDSSQTIAIMGDRGSGKTTLLTSVCASVAVGKRDLVLPIMRPELFHEGDSLLGSFLASISVVIEEASIREWSKTSGEGVNPRTALLQKVFQTAREYAMSRTTIQALEHSSSGPFDFAEDSVAVARSGTSFFWALRRVVDELRNLLDGSTQSLIIVPIDDPDLRPTIVAGILRDLRVLGSIPGVVPIACFCKEDLSEAWLGTMQRELPSLTEDRGMARIARVLEKIFPYRNRFEIEPLTPRQRAEFAPIGKSETLATKLAAFATATAEVTGASSVFATVFTRAEPLLNLESPLPGNPRTLVQVWESLDSFLNGPDERTPDGLILTLRRLVEILGEPFSSAFGARLGGRLVAVGGPVGTGRKLRSSSRRFASFHRHETELFISAAGEFEVTDDSTPSVQLRRLVSIRAMRPSETTNPGVQGREYLQPAAISGLLAVQEIVYGSGAFEVSESPAGLGEAEWRFLQRVTIGGLATDNMFVLLPDAVTLTEIARAAATWERLVDFADRHRTPEAVLAAAIDASCSYVEEEAAAWSPKRMLDYDDAMRRASDLFEQRASSVAHLDRMYCRWYRTLLPHQWHSALFTSQRVRAYIDEHMNRCRKWPESSPEENALALFDARIRTLTDDIDDDLDAQERAWLAGYFDLAAAWGSEHAGRLAELHRHWQRRTTAQRAGAAVLGPGPTAIQRRRMAPYETPEGRELLDAALAVLRRAKNKAMSDLRSSRQ